MIKSVLFGKESRDKILAGVQKITKAVSCTMGAAGKTVLIGESVYGNDGLVHLPTKISKDGYTVARHFSLPDPEEHRGAMMIIEAATKTVEQAGDSTTCTCVLAESLITNGMKLIDDGANSQELKKGMDSALEVVIAELNKMSTPIKGDIEKIRQIASVSSNNDKSIGDLIAEAFSKIGDEGVIDIEASQGLKTEIKITDGYKFDRGWISQLFVTNRAKETCEFLNPLILLYQNRINHHTQVEKAIAIAIQQQRPLLIISEDCVDEGLAYLAINNHRKTIVVCAVKSPFGQNKNEDMEDIALLTGGDYVGDIRGIDIKEVELENLGQAEKVIVSKNETVIIKGNKNETKVDDLINDLRMNLTKAKTEDEKYPIEKRISKLMGKSAVIVVGAATETELNEKIDRVDDAVRSTKAAISEGFVAGGGTAFLISSLRPSGYAVDIGRVSIPDREFNKEDGKIKWDKSDKLPEGVTKISNRFGLGEDLLAKALWEPFLQICENAGIDGLPILKIVLNKEQNIGYNVLTGKIEDMVESGIIDSTKALRCALINAVSVAGMVLTSECSIISTS